MGAYLPDFNLVLPEMFLVAIALLILIEGMCRKTTEPAQLSRLSHMTFFALIAALVILNFLTHPTGQVVSFEGQLIQDNFTYLAKTLILIGTAAVLCISHLPMMKEHLLCFEYFPLILLATVGMLLMVSANDFLCLFMGLEMQALSLYVLTAFERNQKITSEAALKYFILGAVASCFYLYGASLLYGFSGSLNFQILANITCIESIQGLPLGVFVGLIFVIAALAFKISAVPFHMWTPDVYQGSPTPIAAFIAATPKAAAVLVFLRLLALPFLSLFGVWQSLVVFLSMASMVWGAFAALQQTNLKRFLAYSAIGQMGFVLMGVATGNSEGAHGCLLYLTLYLIMIIGTFGCLLCLRGKGNQGVQGIDDLSGIASLHPRVAFAMAIFMLSLAGIPPLAGFFSKMYVFKAALSAGLFGLAFIGALTSVVSAYYYLKIIKVMYLDKIPNVSSLSYGHTVTLSYEAAIILNICALITLLFFIFPNPLLTFIHQAAFILPG